MREMKASEIEWAPEIPTNWKTKKAKYNFENHKYIPGVKSEQYDRLSLTMNGVVPRSKDDADGLQPKDFMTYQLLREGELVFKLIDLQNVSTSRVGLAHSTGLVSPAYIVLKAIGEITPEFAEKYFLMLWHREIFNALGDNGVRSNLNVGDLLSIPICYPSVEEQNRIVDYLNDKCSEIDEIIKNISEEIEELEIYRQYVISEAVKKGEKTRFKYIAKVRSNLVNPALYQDYYQIAPDSIEKNTGKLIAERTVEEAAVDSWNHLFYKGQIIYSKIRPVLNKVIIAPYDGLCCADMYPIETLQNARFLMYAMLSMDFVEQVDLITRDRIKMPKINQDELGNIKVFIPSLSEQQEIVEYLDDKCRRIDDVISHKQEERDALLDYKKSVLYEYITGKKEVPES